MGRLQLHLRKLLGVEKFEEYCSSTCESLEKSFACKSPCVSFCPEKCVESLTPPQSPAVFTYDRENKLHKFLVITLTVFAVTFVALLCYILYFKYYLARRASRRRAQLEAEEFHGDLIDQDHHRPVIDHHVWYINTVGLQPAIISSITVCQYKKGEGLVEGTECAVCLTEFEEDETLRLLPKCNHAFHLHCIDTWLRSHTNCPMCRAPIMKNNAAGAASSSFSGTDNSSTNSHTQVDVAEGNNRESTARELEEGALERRNIVTEDHGSSEAKVDQEIQAIRRSVSLDSVTASKLSKAFANFVNIPEEPKGKSDTQMESDKDSSLEIVSKRITRNGSLPRFVASSSMVRSLQIGPVSFKRSSSCGGKVLLPGRS